MAYAPAWAKPATADARCDAPEPFCALPPLAPGCGGAAPLGFEAAELPAVLATAPPALAASRAPPAIAVVPPLATPAATNAALTPALTAGAMNAMKSL